MEAGQHHSEFISICVGMESATVSRDVQDNQADTSISLQGNLWFDVSVHSLRFLTLSHHFLAVLHSFKQDLIYENRFFPRWVEIESLELS